MSKRAKEKALELFPIDMQMCIDNKGKPYEADVNEHRRKYVAFGYEQAEKDTIERVIDWLQGRSNDYIFRDVYMGKEELKISSQMFEDLKKAMEGEQ